MNQSAAGPAERCPRVLYIVYWGILEPLGQSLVQPAVLELADRGAQITLISFEKHRLGEGGDAERRAHQALTQKGVRWKPLRYHKTPRVPATLFDILTGWVRGALGTRRSRSDVIHARTFVGGLIGVVVARLTRSAFIYHNEGFYPEEQVDSGVWTAGSPPHRLARWLEMRLYESSEGIITLSRRAEAIVRALPGPKRKRTPIAVVPSCVDLRKFVPPRDPVPYSGGGLRFVYAGSIGGRYRFADVASFMAIARAALPGSILTILGWASLDQVSPALREAGVPDGAWSLESVSRDAMPGALSAHHVGLHFATAEAGGAGGSPTKVGEYWACGLPVIVTSGMGDLDEIIQAERVGVLLSEATSSAFRDAILAMERLLYEPQIRQRCRAAAEAHYGLEKAVAEQMQLYGRVCTEATR